MDASLGFHLESFIRFYLFPPLTIFYLERERQRERERESCLTSDRRERGGGGLRVRSKPSLGQYMRSVCLIVNRFVSIKPSLRIRKELD